MKRPALPLTGGCPCEAAVRSDRNAAARVRLSLRRVPALVRQRVQHVDAGCLDFGLCEANQNPGVGSAPVACRAPTGSAAIAAEEFTEKGTPAPIQPLFAPAHSTTPPGCGRSRMSTCGAPSRGSNSLITRNASTPCRRISGHSPTSGSKCGRRDNSQRVVPTFAGTT